MNSPDPGLIIFETVVILLFLFLYFYVFLCCTFVEPYYFNHGLALNPFNMIIGHNTETFLQDAELSSILFEMN